MVFTVAVIETMLPSLSMIEKCVVCMPGDFAFTDGSHADLVA